MSSKNSKNNKVIKKDEKISSVIEIKEKDNKILYILVIIIVLLLSLLLYYMFFKDCKEKEDSCTVPAVDTKCEPDYQLINYAGFRFKMPLDWDFVDSANNYTISDNNEKIFISFEIEDIEYDSFVSNENQNKFLEKIQTSDNIKIDQSSKNDNYYLYDGTYNNYNYQIIAIGNDKLTILVKTQFIDKVTYDNLKNNVLEFAISGIKKSED